ncbi:dynein regulatory complex protein 12-like isoform X2 [Oscarella lobularis]
MPPKARKKGKGKGKKKAKGKKAKKDGKSELTAEDRFKHSVQEIVSLKEHLSIKTELTRRSQSACATAKAKMRETVEKLEEERDDKRAISADLTRQYKSMQNQLEVHVQHLEATVAQLRQDLSLTRAQLETVTSERDALKKEKAVMEADFQVQIDRMGNAYEGVINDSMDLLSGKIEEHRMKWEEESYEIERQNLEAFSEFGYGLRPSRKIDKT